MQAAKIELLDEGMGMVINAGFGLQALFGAYLAGMVSSMLSIEDQRNEC
jgi:hypothetical protein